MTYVPERGDVVWLNFQPQAGSEQSGRRPAIVLSPKKYNQRTQLMICCPISSQIKGYPFEIPFQLHGQPSVILSDHVKSLDWHARQASYVSTIDPDTLQRCIDRLSLLIQG